MRSATLTLALLLLLLAIPAALGTGVSGIPDDLVAALETRRGELEGQTDRDSLRALRAVAKCLKKLAHETIDDSYKCEIKCVARAAKIVMRKLPEETELHVCVADCRTAYWSLLDDARARLAAAAAGSAGSADPKRTKRLAKLLARADRVLAAAAAKTEDFKALRKLAKAAKLLAEYIHDPEPPPPEPVPVPAAGYSGFMGGDGDVHYVGPNYTGHAPVLAGLPQVAWNNRRLPGFHWANDDRWLIHENDADDYGFSDHVDGHVVVKIRSIEQDATQDWEQNDGWFRFRVRVDATTHNQIRFLLDLETSHGVNHWFAGTNASWDWMVFRPLCRVLPPGGDPGPWRHAPAPTVEGGLDSRTPRALYTIDLLALPEHSQHDAYEVEVAQALPYTLEDRAAFFEDPGFVPPAGVHVDKVPLGPGWTPAYGGLSLLAEPQKEENEVYAIALYKEPHATDVILVTAGVHCEPPAMFVLEGLVQAILDDPDVLDRVSFVLFPGANPDAWGWGCAHVRPWGDGQGDLLNGAHWYDMADQDPEAVAIRGYVDHMIQNEGVTILAHVDLHADLAPHPDRWSGSSEGEPPTYGYLCADTPAAEADVSKYVTRLREGPYSKPYTRPLDRWPSFSATPRPSGAHHFPLPQFHVDRGIPVKIVMEYDETALYRANGDDPPPDLPGLPDGAPLVLRQPAGPHPTEDEYWVDGLIDDPTVYRQWGREMLAALMYGFVD